MTAAGSIRSSLVRIPIGINSREPIVTALRYIRAFIDKNAGSLDRGLDSRGFFFVKKFQVDFKRCEC